MEIKYNKKKGATKFLAQVDKKIKGAHSKEYDLTNINDKKIVDSP